MPLLRTGGLSFAETQLPEGGAETAIWVVVAVVIVGLYLVVSRTRKRSERHYWEQRRLEEERRANDPDMRRDDA